MNIKHNKWQFFNCLNSTNLLLFIAVFNLVRVSLNGRTYLGKWWNKIWTRLWSSTDEYQLNSGQECMVRCLARSEYIYWISFCIIKKISSKKINFTKINSFPPHGTGKGNVASYDKNKSPPTYIRRTSHIIFITIGGGGGVSMHKVSEHQLKFWVAHWYQNNRKNRKE